MHVGNRAPTVSVSGYPRASVGRDAPVRGLGGDGQQGADHRQRGLRRRQPAGAARDHRERRRRRSTTPTSRPASSTSSSPSPTALGESVTGDETRARRGSGRGGRPGRDRRRGRLRDARRAEHRAGPLHVRDLGLRRREPVRARRPAAARLPRRRRVHGHRHREGRREDRQRRRSRDRRATSRPTRGSRSPATPSPASPSRMRGFASDPGPDDEHTLTWKFGDGATGSGARVKHAYAAAGTYTVELRADDGDGGVGGGGGRGRGRRPEGAARQPRQGLLALVPDQLRGRPGAHAVHRGGDGHDRARRGPRAGVERPLHGHARRGDRRDAPEGRAARAGRERRAGPRRPRERRRPTSPSTASTGSSSRPTRSSGSRPTRSAPTTAWCPTRAAAVRRPPWWRPPTTRP